MCASYLKVTTSKPKHDVQKKKKKEKECKTW